MIVGAIALAVIVCLGAAGQLLLRRYARLLRHSRKIRIMCRMHLRNRLEARTLATSERALYWERIRQMPAPAVWTTPEGQIVAANTAMLKLLGYGSEEELKAAGAAAMYWDPSERVSRILHSLRQQRTVSNKEFDLKRKSGEKIHALLSIRVVESPVGAQVFEGVFTDITQWRRAIEDNRRLEQQLLLSQKLEAIGRLAAGIAHEINTPIQFIGDNVHFLRELFNALPAGAASESRVSEAAAAFRETLEGLEHVRETVRAMKEFAHPGDGQLTMTNLNEAIQTTLIVARNEYKHIAKMVTNLGELPSLQCRRGELNKAILNLVVNAAHAIESRTGGQSLGRITITTRRSETHVELRVADTGCGIPQSALTRIFDPFFTTKPVGKGTGQGLAIVRTIIGNHGGDISVKSKVGVGTEFLIRLPVLANRAPEEMFVEEAAPSGQLQ
jgi:PAS domain S-box-containing protein